MTDPYQWHDVAELCDSCVRVERYPGGLGFSVSMPCPPLVDAWMTSEFARDIEAREKALRPPMTLHDWRARQSYGAQVVADALSAPNDLYSDMLAAEPPRPWWRRLWPW